LHAVHHNWIDGRPTGAAGGDGFEVKADGSRTPIGRWPRSGSRDLEAALGASARAEGAWSALRPRERRTRLESALERWVGDRRRDAITMAALGCTSLELDSFVDAAAREVERLFERSERVPNAFDPRAGGANVLLADWTEAWSGPARFAFGALLAGRALVLVADPRLPMIADGLAEALAPSAGGVLSVLHDDGRTVIRAALAHEDVARVHLPSISEVADECLERGESERTTVIERGFGAGIEVACEKKLSVRVLSNASYIVSADAPLESQAGEVVDRAFGRVASLSGFAPLRIGRVLVPTRSFSRFTELLLEILEHDPDASEPLGLARAVARPHVERAFALGHDEGATAVFTGFEARALSFPLVFTNVEERMKLARVARPAPVTCLMRVKNAAAAREVAARIDV
jgi:acyl-CoA reductase-like NAD-dependent aldehyde dehydrogenase